MSKLLILVLLVAWLVQITYSATPTLLPMHIDLSDRAKLQRGAQLFMNYCSGCHSLRYLRYNRMGKDLGLDKNVLVNNLIFTTAKITDPMTISMPAVDARQWFGLTPPDLSLIAREQGADWIYTYLKSFYADNSRPFGANNILVPDTAMPNVLAPLQGQVVAVHENLILSKKGEMSPQQFASLLDDLVTFLVYVGEPVQLIRYRMGIIVITFLAIFLLIAYRLKKLLPPFHHAD